MLSHIDATWAALASVLTFGLIVMLALRWKIFLRQQHIEQPFSRVLALTWAGQFFNSILPGSTGGDVVKLYQICRLAPERKAAAASTVFVDRLSALIALAVLAAIALLRDPRPLRVFNGLRLSFGKAVVLALFALVVGGLIACIAIRLSHATHLRGRVVRTLAAARQNLVLNGNLLLGIVLSFAIHLLNFAIIYLFARALGIPISYPQVLLMMPVVLLLMLLPVTINGHGLRELLLITYFGLFGLAVTGHADVAIRETAVALSLVAVANDLLWSIPGGVLYLTAFRAPPTPQAETTSRPTVL